MELIIAIGSLVSLGYASLRWGVDSRGWECRRA